MKRIISLTFILLLCIFLTRVNAADLYVTNVNELYNAFDTVVDNDQDDVIHIASGVYDLTSTVKYNPYTENYTLTIEGAGIGSTILDGGGIVQIMYIDTRPLSDDSQAHITIRGITFQNGIVTNESGAGLDFASNDALITVENSAFLNNISSYGGGGIYARVDAGGAIKLINNIFYKNQANGGNGGGAVTYSYNGANITLINNTFLENTSSNVGGGAILIFSTAIGTGNVYNNIIWNNTANLGNDLMISNQQGNAANLYNNDFSDFDRSVPGSISEGNNINQDPLLTADFHLQTNSPCINTGNNSAPGIPSTDFEGQSRIVESVVDIGADEYHLLGDINDDGKVDISDVILVLRIALALDNPKPCSDINADSKVDISDVILTLRMALGLDPLEPCIG